MKHLLTPALLLLALILPATASAYDFEVGGIYYNINGNEVTVTSSPNTNNYSGDMAIPASVTNNGINYSVTSIGYKAFYFCSNLTSIKIPKSITMIENHAFSGCTMLASITVASENTTFDSRNNCNAIIETATNVLVVGCKNTTIPNSVTSIGQIAFWCCFNLTSINIPNSVTSIEDAAFQACTGLPSINLPNSVTNIGALAFADCSGLTNILIPNTVEHIGDRAFTATAWFNNQPDGLVYAGSIAYKYKGTMNDNTNIIIRDQTKGIADCAFEGYSELISIDIPNSVCTIGNRAFRFCDKLTSVEIPNSVYSIGYSAFEGCTRLNEISIPNSINEIGRDAFTETAWFNNQPDGLVYAGSVAYKYKGIMPDGTNIALRDGTLGIAASAFIDCKGLTNITMPNSVTNISHNAFTGCSGLKSINLPNSITTIRNYAFYGCISMQSLNIPNTITIISDDAFARSGLTSIHIPNSVIEIGNRAFNECSELISIDIPSSVKIIRDNAFYGCIGLTDLIWNARNCTSMGDMYRTGIECVTIGQEVETLPNGFVSDSKIVEINIPNSVTTIGDEAFEGCSGLKSVTIGSSVTFIGKQAFQNAAAIESVTCEAMTPPTWEALDLFPTNVYNHTPLVVPNGCARTYMTDQCWGQFVRIVSTSDVNMDGYVSISDVTSLISLLLTGSSNPAADVNGDGKVSISDVTALINLVLSGGGY